MLSDHCVPISMYSSKRHICLVCVLPWLLGFKCPDVFLASTAEVPSRQNFHTHRLPANCLGRAATGGRRLQCQATGLLSDCLPPAIDAQLYKPMASYPETYTHQNLLDYPSGACEQPVCGTATSLAPPPISLLEETTSPGYRRRNLKS